jgi:hypothetical protein
LPEVELSFSGKVGKQMGNTETIPVWLTNYSGARVSSFGFTVTYNEKIRQPLGFAIETTETLAEGCVVTSNTDIPGRICIAGTCPNGVAAAAGSLLKLRFTAPSFDQKAFPYSSNLHFRKLRLLKTMRAI